MHECFDFFDSSFCRPNIQIFPEYFQFNAIYNNFEYGLWFRYRCGEKDFEKKLSFSLINAYLSKKAKKITSNSIILADNFECVSCFHCKNAGLTDQ